MDGSVPRKLPKMVAVPSNALTSAKACKPYTTWVIRLRVSMSVELGPGPRGCNCCPSSMIGSLQSEIVPHCFHAGFHVRIHDDRTAPFAGGFAFPLIEIGRASCRERV